MRNPVVIVGAVLCGLAVFGMARGCSSSPDLAGATAEVAARVYGRAVEFDLVLRDESGRQMAVPRSSPFVVVRDAAGKQVYRGAFQFG